MFSKRGEVITTTLLIVAIIATFLFAGSQLNPFKTPGQKIKQTMVTKSESKPIIVRGEDGKQYILQITKSETSSLDIAEEPKMTLWQRLLLLPKLWVLFMVLGIFFPPIAMIMAWINSKLKYGLKQIVHGVEEGLNNGITVEGKQKVLDILSKRYDSSTKLLVSKIKQKV